ncbi:RDD family protein [Micromonospora sp. NPDC049801]|uniref:RDD family protein n=1 Tax=unclassified Micromonospora TaxID=2617518 RepID=UPI0033FBFA71
MSVEPGWYVDPADRETRRYWDGEGWLGAAIPVDATPPDGPPPPEPPPVPVTPAGSPSAETPPGWPPQSGQPAHPGPGPQSVPPPGWGPQGTPPPGWGPQGGPPPGWGPQNGPAGWSPQSTPPGWSPQSVPPGWGPGWPGRPPEPRPHGLRLAGYGRRLVARLIDFAVVFALNVLVNGWFVWRWLEELTPYWREAFRRGMEGNTSREGLPPISEQAGLLQVAIVVIATALWLAYEVPAMAGNGQTIGKRVMRIRAVPIEADQPLGFGRALRRWTTLGMSTLLWPCFGIGLLVQLIDSVSPLVDHPLRRALHDRGALTVVVEVPATTGPPASDDHPQPSGDTP